MMHWEKLLSLKRQGDTTKRLRSEQDDTRLGFEVDYDRIVFSAYFRSLQDKTQVIPLSKTSFVHTRLTHSLEVSVVGRSLGRIAGKAILEKYPHLQTIHKFQFNDFGAIVAAAALAHDIGNPPFGHSGEKAIGNYFLNGAGKRFKENLTPKQYQDLIDFEGNANGFKILTETKNGVSGGLRLSYATLGAFMKYPKESLPKKETNHIVDKKYGIFQTEKDFFIELASELGLMPKNTGKNKSFYRHPLAYLVEAADDICYTIIDFEDGINLGLIEEDLALEYLIKLVKDTINKEKYVSLTKSSDRLAYLRSLAINSLITEAANLFITNETKILQGEFPTSLLEKSKYRAQIDDIIKISIQKIYKSNEVIHKEMAGYTIIETLLDVITKACENHFNQTPSHYDSLVFNQIRFSQKDLPTVYDYLINTCTYISQLTDGRSMQLFKQIKGNL
jgi:dGTPase